MRRAGQLVAVVFVAVLSASCGGSSGSTTALPESSLQAILDRAVGPGGAPGAILAVRTPQGTWAGAAGFSDPATSDPMQPGMQVRLASVTKPITALAVLRLAEQGALRLGDTVERWLPGRVTGGDRMTVAMLLNHSAGVPDHEELPAFWDRVLLDPAATWSASDVLAFIAGVPPDFEPGTEFRYSNTGYYLLGLIAEAASGRNGSALFDELVFRPAGLSRTRLARDGMMQAPLAHGFTWVPPWDRLVDDTAWNLSWDWTAGSGVSTALDMLDLFDAVYAGRVVAPGTLDFMLRPAGPEPTQGLGFGIVNAGHPYYTWIVGHSGANPGTATHWYRFPEADVTIFVAINRCDLLSRPDDPQPFDGQAASFEIFREAWLVLQGHVGAR